MLHFSEEKCCHEELTNVEVEFSLFSNPISLIVITAHTSQSETERKYPLIVLIHFFSSFFSALLGAMG